MAKNSEIEWTDHTFNPWWGCTKVSPGCTNCYAEVWARRYGHNVWGPKNARRFFSNRHWNQPLIWNRQAERHGRRARVFCASMADVFEDNPVLTEERERLWQLIEQTPMLDWLLLTKRPENMLRMTPWTAEWPRNIWAMTSVENQQQALKRLPILIDIPASVRGISAEPLIGSVDLTSWIQEIDWVIVGGESGRNARPMHPEWARKLRDDCIEAKVPFFFKQWGKWAPTEHDTGDVLRLQASGRDSEVYVVAPVGKKAAGRLLDGRTWDEVPAGVSTLPKLVKW